MIAECYGQKFGHNFPYPGAKCLNCGVNQNYLSQNKVGGVSRITAKIIQPKKNLHSKIHLLADELSKYFHEPKKFGMYLGVAKRIGFAKAQQIFAEVKDSKAREPKKLFMWKVKQLTISNKQ
jgi:hypothetical protein